MLAQEEGCACCYLNVSRLSSAVPAAGWARRGCGHAGGTASLQAGAKPGRFRGALPKSWSEVDTELPQLAAACSPRPLAAAAWVFYQRRFLQLTGKGKEMEVVMGENG